MSKSARWLIGVVVFMSMTGSQAAATAVFWGRDFVDSVGANLHLLHPDSFYGQQFELMKSRLLEAHIRHVRDGAMDYQGKFFDGDQRARFQELGQAGIKVTYIFRLSASAAFVQGWPARVAPSMEAYESPNELNLAQGTPWPGATQQWMPVFWHYVKDAPASASYPVLGPSIADMGNDPYGQLGSQAQYLDYGNLHKYYLTYNPSTEGYGAPAQSPCNPLRYGSLSYELCLMTKVAGRKSVICTEAGYGTNVAAGNQVPPDIQAKFIARMLLVHLQAGIVRTYIYQFADYGTDGFGAYGVLNSDGSAKPSFVELKALTTELDDVVPAGKPTNLDVALSGAMQDVSSVLFQKTDGSYRLLLWVEKPGVDPLLKTRLSVASQNVTLGLPAGYRVRRVLAYGGDGNATVTTPAAGPLNVAVQDNITMVDIDITAKRPAPPVLQGAH